MKKKLRIVADEAIPFLKGVLEPFAEMLYLPGNAISKKNVENADALLVRTRTSCNAELLENSSVKMIATATIGMDHLDKSFLERQGIFYTNAPACNADSVVQYFVAALLEMCERQKKDFRDMTLGIVGVGNIGSRIFQIGKILGMRVLCCDLPKQEQGNFEIGVSFKTICEESDVITFHTPLTRTGLFPTYHMFDENALSWVKKPFWLFNASRGEVLSEKALKWAIETGICSAAVIDVFENEPVIHKSFLEKISIATPHIAGYSLDGKANATSQIVRQVASFFDIPELKTFNVEFQDTDKKWVIDFKEINTLVGQIQKVYRLSYDINQDDFLLRKNPEQFEWFRKNYPKRREPKAYKILIQNFLPETKEILEKLGFVIEN